MAESPPCYIYIVPILYFTLYIAVVDIKISNCLIHYDQIIIVQWLLSKIDLTLDHVQRANIVCKNSPRSHDDDDDLSLK